MADGSGQTKAEVELEDTIDAFDAFDAPFPFWPNWEAFCAGRPLVFSHVWLVQYSFISCSRLAGRIQYGQTMLALT